MIFLQFVVIFLQGKKIISILIICCGPTCRLNISNYLLIYCKSRSAPLLPWKERNTTSPNTHNMNMKVSKVTSSQLLLPFESFSASSAVTQVESMNIHEPPRHINQMNYAARFMAAPPPPPPHSLANNSQCQPLWVLRHRRGWQLCRDPTWPCQRPVGGRADRVSTLWPRSKEKVQSTVSCSGHDATMSFPLWGLKKKNHIKKREKKNSAFCFREKAHNNIKTH